MMRILTSLALTGYAIVCIARPPLAPAIVDDTAIRARLITEQTDVVRGATPNWNALTPRLTEEVVKRLPRDKISYYETGLSDTTITKAQQAKLLVELAGDLQETAEPQLSKSIYARALPNARGSDRLVANNNYAVLLLSENEGAAEALERLRDIEADMRRQSAEQQMVYRRNYAKALASVGDADGALVQLQASIRANVSTERVGTVVWESAAKATEIAAAIKTCASIVETLIDQGRLADAENILRRGLSYPAWQTQPEVSHYLYALLRWLAMLEITGLDALKLKSDSVEAESWYDILTADSWATNVEPIVEDLVEFYQEPPNVRLGNRADRHWQQRYSHWSAVFADRTHERLIQLLRAIGDEYHAHGLLENALNLNTLAWYLGLTDIEGPLRIAAVLSDGGEDLDPDGDLLSLLINELFAQKARAYQRQQPASIVQFHTMLGRIFSSRAIFGPAESPSSAVFQFHHAIRMFERELERGEMRDATALPALYTNLARAYVGLGERDKAAENYGSAAALYSSQRRPKRAELVMVEAGKQSDLTID